jgi:hypothetical protein
MWKIRVLFVWRECSIDRMFVLAQRSQHYVQLNVSCKNEYLNTTTQEPVEGCSYRAAVLINKFQKLKAR